MPRQEPGPPPATPAPPAVELRGITKTFPGVIANKAVNLELRRGEIHAILGENGAGKTSLMNVIYGLYRPDAGEILIDGRRTAIRNPRHAMRLGIGMVAQHPMLVNRLSVAENVALALDTPFVNPTRSVEPRIRQLSERYGLSIDPRAQAWQLSAGERQRVEILKLLARDANVLILDEPTSVLTPQEAHALLDVLARMRDDGRAIAVITHKLDEVMRGSDRVTVLRRGEVVAGTRTRDTDAATLARLMVGRDLTAPPAARPTRPPSPEAALETRDLWVAGDRGVHAVREVSLELHPGEILGVAGVAGNGQRELVEALTGLRHPERGRIRVNGRDLTRAGARALARAGVAHIPEDRLHSGVVGAMTVAENLMLRDHDRPPMSRAGILDPAAADARAERAITEHDIRASGPHARTRLLSGGNVQKVILARELSGDPSVVIAAHPTYGLDAGATRAVHDALLERRARGAAVLVVSEDLDEILTLADRVAVMYEGRIVATLARDEADAERLGLLMAGRAA